MIKIEIKNNSNSWKTTKKVANALGLATDTILSFRNTHKELFKGLVMVSPVNTKKGVRDALLWSPEAIKILMLNISNPQTDQWKEDVIDEYTEKGIIFAKTADINIIEKQWELLGNLIKSKKQQNLKILRLSKEQDAMQKELANHSRIIENHMKEHPIQDNSIKIIRDLIQDLYETRGISIWNELHTKFHFSKLGRISEEKGQKIIEYIKNRYY